jgi:dihydropteroate synthase
MKFRAREFEWDLSKGALVMGVINVTPDSFSDGGECLAKESALERARAFRDAGADILDVGAESSRPGAERIPVEEELRRLLPVLDRVVNEFKMPVSVDTTKAEVAEKALERGAAIVNDVSGLKADAGVAPVAARFQAGVVLMHRRGDAQTMQGLASYQNLIPEMLEELKESVDIAFQAGISYDRIVIDPGIGFAKTKEQNLSLIKHLSDFSRLGFPVLVGPSRKSFLGALTGRAPKERVFGTAASVALAIERGAKILRVHDVREIKEVVQVTEAILKAL